MVAVTNVFGAMDTVVASQLNTNFDDLEAALASLDTSNLADDAGIRSTQLADRYAVWHDSFFLVPPVQNYGTGPVHQLRREAETGANTGVIIDGNLVAGNWGTFLSEHAVFDSAQEVYLCEIEVRVAFRSANTQFRIQIDGVTVGGAGVTLDTNGAYYRIRNSNPIDDPIYAVPDGAVITYDLNPVGTGTDFIRGVHIRTTWKSRLNN